MTPDLKRVNIGCGQTPTRGWLNYDNSLSIRLSKYPILVAILEKLGLLGEESKGFISFAKTNNIIWADAAQHIPLEDNCVEVLYTSHMVEHLDSRQIKRFLQEAYRVLIPNGIVRIAVPDLRMLVDQYIADGDADSFVEQTLLAQEKPQTLLERVRYVVVGPRDHLWMYDGQSLCRLLSAHGFREPRVVEPGSTIIPDPGDLDLYERASQSVYVEALK